LCPLFPTPSYSVCYPPRAFLFPICSPPGQACEPPDLFIFPFRQYSPYPLDIATLRHLLPLKLSMPSQCSFFPPPLSVLARGAVPSHPIQCFGSTNFSLKVLPLFFSLSFIIFLGLMTLHGLCSTLKFFFLVRSRETFVSSCDLQSPTLLPLLISCRICRFCTSVIWTHSEPPSSLTTLRMCTIVLLYFTSLCTFVKPFHYLVVQLRFPLRTPFWSSTSFRADCLPGGVLMFLHAAQFIATPPVSLLPHSLPDFAPFAPQVFAVRRFPPRLSAICWVPDSLVTQPYFFPVPWPQRFS